jgi:hypothetical protein
VPSRVAATSRRDPVLFRVLPGLVIAIMAVKALGPVSDPDTFWHIASGEHLWETGQFVLPDPFGASAAKVWILNQWLPELAMYWAHAAYGLAGVAWLTCLGVAGVGVAVWWSCRRWTSPLACALLVTTVFVALGPSVSPRPQLVTFALTAVTVGTWLRTRSDGKARWWLVAVTWLWACSHGMWFLGPVIGVITVAGMVLERRVSVRAALTLAAVPVASVVVAGLTPVGPGLYASPLQVHDVTPYISEWQRADLGSPSTGAALALVSLAIAGILRRRMPVAWTPLLLALLALGLSLAYARTVGLGAIVAAPLAAKAVGDLTGLRPDLTSRTDPKAVAIACVAALVLTGVLAPRVAAAPGSGPHELDPALSALPAGTIVCNDERDGGWLILRHPNLRPTMDTRVELYSVEHILGYRAFMTGGSRVGSYVAGTGCTAALLPSGSAPAKSLAAQTNWRTAASGGGYLLLTGRS